MGHYQDNIVFYRDFGYPNHRRRIFNMPQNGNIGEATAKTFAELLSGPTVDIYVGDEKRHWSLHRNLLCYHSEYLKAQLQSSPDSTPKSKNKGASDSLRLDLADDDPAGFELLVKWLYQGKLDDVSSLSDEQAKYDYAVACQKLHILCDRFEMPKLKNIAIDQYRKGLSEAGLVPDADELDAIYRSSARNSPFRRLMVKIAARQIMDPDSDKDAENYRQCFEQNPDFAIDLVNAVKWGTGGVLFDDPTEGADCEFHDHDNGPNCHNKGKKKLGSSKSTSPATSSPPTTPTPRSRRASPPKQAHLNGVVNNDAAPAAQRRAPNSPSPVSSQGGAERGGAVRTPSPPSYAATGTRNASTGRKPPPKLRRKSPEPPGTI